MDIKEKMELLDHTQDLLLFKTCKTFQRTEDGNIVPDYFKYLSCLLDFRIKLELIDPEILRNEELSYSDQTLPMLIQNDKRRRRSAIGTTINFIKKQIEQIEKLDMKNLLPGEKFSNTILNQVDKVQDTYGLDMLIIFCLLYYISNTKDKTAYATALPAFLQGEISRIKTVVEKNA